MVRKRLPGERSPINDAENHRPKVKGVNLDVFRHIMGALRRWMRGSRGNEIDAEFRNIEPFCSSKLIINRVTDRRFCVSHKAHLRRGKEHD
jgi:hypothetical protein